MLHKYKVFAEIDLDANDCKLIEITATTEKKAIKYAEEKLKKQGAFHVRIDKVVKEN